MKQTNDWACAKFACNQFHSILNETQFTFFPELFRRSVNVAKRVTYHPGFVFVCWDNMESNFFKKWAFAKLVYIRKGKGN